MVIGMITTCSRQRARRSITIVRVPGSPVRISFYLGRTAGDGRVSSDSPQSDDLVIESVIGPQPLQTGPVILDLKARDAASRPITGAQIELEGDMSHPGMAPILAGLQKALKATTADALTCLWAGIGSF